MLEHLTSHLAAAQHLSDEQVHAAVEHLTDEKIPAAVKAQFLIQLACKGESIGEIAAFARALRDKAVIPPIDAATRAREILDVVGTGGDRLGTFNISTTVAIICAAAGVTVAKHGNRAVTSQVGSADVLEALGIKIDLSPAEAARSLREKNFAFFFAPNYHPAFKHIGPARKLCGDKGQRTVFNFLGPLLNPARPSAQLVGVPRPELCEPLAHVLQSLGIRRAMVVCGKIAPLRILPADFEQTNRIQKIHLLDTDGQPLHHITDIPTAVMVAKQKDAALVAVGPAATPPIYGLVDIELMNRLGLDDLKKENRLDELSTLGENTIAEFYQERGFTVSTLSPDQFPLQPATLADLLGGDRATNAEIVRRILHGDERGPKRDAVLLNAAAALFVAGKTKSLVAGWELAEATIDSGQARAKLADLAA